MLLHICIPIKIPNTLKILLFYLFRKNNLNKSVQNLHVCLFLPSLTRPTQNIEHFNQAFDTYSSDLRKVDDGTNNNNEEHFQAICLLLQDSQHKYMVQNWKTIPVKQKRQTYQNFVEDTDSQVWNMTSPARLIRTPCIVHVGVKLCLKKVNKTRM